MDFDLLTTIKSVADVVVPLVIVPLSWVALRIFGELREVRHCLRTDRREAVDRFHKLELRQSALEIEQKFSQQQRDHNHGEILRRLDELTEAVKGKADKPGGRS